MLHITKTNGRTETWRYAYDPLGRRTDKWSETNKNLHIEFVWDGSHLIQERNAQETYTYLYTHPNSYEPLAQLNEDGEVYYYHCDQIGAPRELTNQNGELCWHASYKGWGELQGEHNLKGVHQPIRLQNQYFDRETGLHYNFLRYYEPTIGRFITQDPIGLTGGENLYRFEGNVQNAIDPLGLDTYKCTRALGQPSGTWAPPLLNHTYLCTGENENNMYCSSTTQKNASGILGSIFSTESRPTTSKEDSYSEERCSKESTNMCVESCVDSQLRSTSSRRPYAIGPAGEDCQEYSSRILSECRKICNTKK